MFMDYVIWIVYIALFFYLARKGKGEDFVISGKVGVIVQSFAYVATYISAVSLVGMGGLSYIIGMQGMLVAIGNAFLGTLFVYLVLAWKTKELQIKLGARTPADLLALGHKLPLLKKILGFIFAFFLSIYAAAVIKGAGLMLQSIVPFSLEICIWILAICVGFAVLWGGLKGVLLTEAMQGAIMLLGICLLAYNVLTLVGGPVDGVIALSKLAPTAQANNGFLSISSGEGGYLIWSITIVTSIAIWVQPQIIQRHFSINNKNDIKKGALLASFTLLCISGGMFFICALSRLILPEITNPDQVVPSMVDMLLSNTGKQIFSLAIISASLSTCTALFHIAVSSLVEDVCGTKANTKTWTVGVIICVLAASFTAQLEGKFIVLIVTTSWSVIGASALVPYLSLVLFKKSNPFATFSASMAGGITCLFYYLLLTPQTSLVQLDFISKEIKLFPPFIIGVLFSFLAYSTVSLIKKSENISS